MVDDSWKLYYRINSEVEAKAVADEIALLRNECDALRKIAEAKMDEVAALKQERNDLALLVTSTKAELQEQLAAYQKDAERWRKVRLMDYHSSALYDVFNPCSKVVEAKDWRVMSDEEYATHIDAAIDAAMKGEK